MARKFLMVLLLILLSVSLDACGRKSKPIAPESADPQYPRQYPAPQPVPATPKDTK